MTARSRRLRCILFDLDETLYPRAAGLMQAIGRRITLYMEQVMGMEPEEVKRRREHYYRRYGTTMRGLQLHHGVDPDHYLHFVHDIPLEEYIAPNGRLDAVLAALPQTKVVFTNASTEHARRVMEILGVSHHFSHIIDVRAMDYVGKPNPEAYQRALRILGARAGECMIVEDNVRNLRPAKALGMITVLVDGDREDGVDFVIAEVGDIGEVVARVELGE